MHWRWQYVRPTDSVQDSFQGQLSDVSCVTELAHMTQHMCGVCSCVMNVCIRACTPFCSQSVKTRNSLSDDYRLLISLGCADIDGALKHTCIDTQICTNKHACAPPHTNPTVRYTGGGGSGEGWMTDRTFKRWDDPGRDSYGPYTSGKEFLM